MAMQTKNTREHILSLYGHISGVKKFKHVHEDVEKLSDKMIKSSGSLSSSGICCTLRIRSFI